MDRNVELLEQTMRYILDHPEEHNQQTWDCGTSACFAGWAARLSGQQLATFDGVVVDGDITYKISMLLGLTIDEGSQLFHGDNTVDDLQHMVKQLVNGESIL